MKKYKNLLSYLPKRFLALPIIALAILVPAAVMAWSPDRTTFTMEHPASYPVFNSITNNPNYGDEREFTTIKDLTTGEALSAQTKLIEGHEYQVQVYIHNNASETLNDSGVGIAKDVTVRALLPQFVDGNATVAAFVNASNTNPGEVYDTAKLTSDNKVELEYVSGSAMLHTNFQQTTLADSLITDGVKVGDKDLSGTWNGCLNSAGAVTFKIKVKAEAKFEMFKKVSKHGQNQWVDSLETTPGEVVDYIVYYKNTGAVQQDNVVIKDNLPEGMAYVAGSSTLSNSQNPDGAKISDNITTDGVNIGSYAPNGNAWVIFSAKVNSNDSLPECGENTLHNVATVETDNGSKEDDANVTTNKTCVQPVYECSALSVKTISRTQYQFTATSKIENADFVKYTYVVKDADGKEISNSTSQNYVQQTAGKYSVQAYLTVDVDGQEKTVTADSCKANFEVTEQPVDNIYTCKSLNIVKKSRDTYEFTVLPSTQGQVVVKQYTFSFGDGQSLTVGAGQETQTHTYATPGDYTTRVSIAFAVDGKIVTDVTSDDCAGKLTVGQPPIEECKPGIPVGDERCTETPQQPETPEELPSTGIEATIGTVFGTGAIGLGLTSWTRSRRAIKNTIKK
ncbi:MAG: PKD domain-containing protein [Candidatus Woesebacteria bacterium]|jgi:uncharacterized repeat protein (TIGR01451 family)